MDTIEDLGHRAGAAAVAAAAQVADPDDGMRRIRDDAGPIVPSGAAPRPARRPSRPWALVAAAAAVVAIGTTAVVIAGRDDSSRLSPDPTHTPITTAPPPPTSTSPTTSAPLPSTPPPLVTTAPIAVSYLDPPPELTLQQFATVPLSGDVDDPSLGAVVTEDGVLLHLGGRTYMLVHWDGTQIPIEFEVSLSLWAAGPGQVAYGTTGDPRNSFRLAAVALGGDRVGEEIWSMPVNAGGDMLGEVPFGAWGHGPTGLTQRDDGYGGRQIAPYVDLNGLPLTAPIDAPEVFLTHTFDPPDDVVQSLDGARRWDLDILAHPDGTNYEGTGRPQATPTADGGAVIWRHIGEDSSSGGFADSTLNVFGVLRPDGTGSWYSMPEGSTVLASDLWGTVFSWIDDDSSIVHLATADLAAPPDDVDLCRNSAQLIVETLVERRLAAVDGSDCVDPTVLTRVEPPCWVECLDGRLTDADVGAVGETFNPLTNENGWYAPVAVTFTNEFGFRTQRQEGWTLRRDADGRIAVAAINVTLDGTDAGASESLVREYLDHIAGGRYEDAAALLGVGGAPFADRTDLQQLGPPAETDVVEALRAWCEAPAVGGTRALCSQPDAISTNITATTIDVTAWYVLDGRTVTATFTGGTSEGIPFVRGIPPKERPYPADDVATLATAYRASRMVVSTSTGFWLAADGSAVFVDTGSAGSASIDGEFAYWTAWGDVSGPRSVAVLLDGTQVCAVDGAIHHVRERAEGGYVATVERPTGAPVDSADTPVPAFAVDCATGDEQPIAAVSWTAEASSRSTLDAGTRTFTSEGDAEGNVVITNEDGVRVTGPEWAISADFTDDGSTVVVGEGGVGNPGVHDTNRLVARDTTTGDADWSVSLPRRFTTFWIVGDQVIVAHEPPGTAPSGMVHAEYTIVGLATGDILGAMPATVQIQDIS
jgi:hypothetical protein